jgi:GNAT superfamily N-acetyltransferase
MILEKISSENLAVALAAATAIFPYEVREGKLSLAPAYLEAIEKDWPHFAYYLVLDCGHLVGITGHYPPKDEFTEIWLGWFGVMPSFRGQGYGTKILRETCRIVASLGVTEMLIYSGDRDEERKAHELYVRNGFDRIGVGHVGGEPVLFFRGPVPLKTAPEVGA